MSEQKSNENLFKFSLYQEDDLVIERCFPADIFNPMARYSVNIKELIPSIMQRLQRLLSKRNANYKVDYGDKSYSLLSEYQKFQEVYKKYNLTLEKLIAPLIYEQEINGKFIRGVKFRFCFFINNNMIVERVFYVDNYNPAIRFSTDIVNTVNEITDDIYLVIKKNDVNNIWDDFNIIEKYGFPHINNVRELNKEQRELYLKNINNGTFIRSVKSQFRRPNTEETTVGE